MIRDWLRAVRIVGTVAPIVVSFRRDYRRWIRWGGPVRRDARFHERRAQHIVRSLSDLGPTFIKLAQIFATRADLVPEPYLRELGTLTDRVPPVPWPIIRAVLHAAWGVDPNRVLHGLDPAPLAAGSLGQVHRARYHEREVVVKVLRPGVEALVARDVRIARWIVDRIYARFPNHHVRGFRIVLDEFAEHVVEEMNYVREGAQCNRMRERFADEPRLRIPEVVNELTRTDVLVMQYLPGTRIDQLDDRVSRGELSPITLVETLIECYALMMLRDGVFHADPHPGNLLVDPEGRIILLDFGMVIDVEVVTRKALFDTVIAAVRRNVDGTTDGFYALGMVAPGTPRDSMKTLVETLLDIAYSQSAMADRAQVLADRVLRELFDWPIILPGELVYFARTATLIEGIGARYDKNFNSIRVASPVVMRLRKEVLVALVGDIGVNDPIVRIAATLGAVAGGAAALFDTTKSRWIEAAQQKWLAWQQPPQPPFEEETRMLTPGEQTGDDPAQTSKR